MVSDGGVLGPVDVHLRPIAATNPPREGEYLPEIGEELLDLLGGEPHVASALLHRLRVPRQSGIQTCAPPGPRSSPQATSIASGMKGVVLAGGDRLASGSADADHEQAPAARLRPADGDVAIDALREAGVTS